MGYQVIAVDTGEDKRAFCLSLGAKAFFDFRTSSDLTTDINTATKGGAHTVLVTSGSEAAYVSACYYLRRTGTLLVVGLPPNANFSAPIAYVARQGINIKGIFVGNRKHASDALDLVARGKVKPSYTIRGLSELNE